MNFLIYHVNKHIYILTNSLIKKILELANNPLVKRVIEVLDKNNDG